MYIRTCMYVYRCCVCTLLHKYRTTCTPHTLSRARACARARALSHAHKQTHIHPPLFLVRTHTYVCIHVCTCVRARACVCVCVCVCVRAYVSHFYFVLGVSEPWLQSHLDFLTNGWPPAPPNPPPPTHTQNIKACFSTVFHYHHGVWYYFFMDASKPGALLGYPGMFIYLYVYMCVL